MKNINIGKLSIPVTQYASQGNAVLGIRDSGKSYSATWLAEQLYAARVPFVAFDPSGVWKFLRVPGKGPGLPIVVAGGKAPDLPLTPQSAAEIVRAAMKSNVSLVLDLYDIHMSKADWSRIVESCVRVLLYENGEHGLRHIFIEEAAEFAPQQIAGEKAKVYAEIEKLARIGGNALLGYTLINQRAEQVNKAVLELCDCLFLHRQKGKNSIKSLEKWLELSQGSDVKEIVRGLPTLPSGECWVWPAGAEHAVHVKMPQKNTFHPDRRALIANPAAANVQRVDATAFVAELRGNLEKYVEEAKANDPAELKKRIKELEKQLAAGGGKTNADIVEARQTGEREGWNRGVSHGYKLGWDERAQAVRSALEAMSPGMTPVMSSLSIDARPENSVRSANVNPPRRDVAEMSPKIAAGARARQIDGRASAGDAELGTGGKRRIMTALAQYPEGLTQRKLSILVDISPKGGTWRTYMAELRGRGWVEGGKAGMRITDAGLKALGPYDPLPTGDALIEYWRQRLGDSGKRKIFDSVCAVYPGSISVEDVSRETNIATSGGTWRTYMAELRGLGIIEGRGELRASEDLF